MLRHQLKQRWIVGGLILIAAVPTTWLALDRVARHQPTGPERTLLDGDIVVEITLPR